LKILKIIAVCLVTHVLYADKVEITSLSMKAENLKKEIHFIGDAKVKKGDDWLHANKIIVYFDDQNKTKMYQATGAVSFKFKNKKNNYSGSADKIIYHPLTSKYLLEGKVKIDDLVKKRHVDGDRISLDMITGDLKVDANRKQPVKFIFYTEKK